MGMDPSRWQQIEELYHAALECEPSERAALLARTDPELRREVESLLAQPDGATPLDHPAWEGAASLLASTVAVPAAGTQLGPYKIEGPLGSGGMGAVFLATDTRLGRSVAIKTSQEQFSVRFDREARAISALNHPHICTLFDVGPNYLVMELCEGETLAARLKRGKLSIQETLRYGAQIADALAAAHAKGIVHRDLKPGNIMLTKAGVKVLDFGLAKSPQDETLTGSRVVLGTPAYMAPEQREGKECDARSDIYSLGLVLYEMSAGKRMLQGQPTATELPPRLAHVVERCLADDPENRWQTARDVKTELEWSVKEDVRATAEKVPRRALFPWLGGAAALAGGSGLAAWVWRAKSATTPVREIRFQLAPPENTWLGRSFTSQSLALSPIGGRVAMIAHGDRSMIWIKNLDSLTASPLEGTDGATMVFWSPDAEFIGFWAGGKLRKIPAAGGTPLPICDLPPVCTATWNQDGAIVAAQALGVSFNISAKSGAVSPGKPRQWPKFLPGGKYLLYLNPDPNIGGLRAYVADAATGHETELMPTDTLVTFTPDQPGSSQGHLLSRWSSDPFHWLSGSTAHLAGPGRATGWPCGRAQRLLRIRTIFTGRQEIPG
jgi:eukaryotic-like serine/threonine-protein kinase